MEITVINIIKRTQNDFALLIDEVYKDLFRDGRAFFLKVPPYFWLILRLKYIKNLLAKFSTSLSFGLYSKWSL